MGTYSDSWLKKNGLNFIQSPSYTQLIGAGIPDLENCQKLEILISKGPVKKRLMGPIWIIMISYTTRVLQWIP